MWPKGRELLFIRAEGGSGLRQGAKFRQQIKHSLMTGLMYARCWRYRCACTPDRPWPGCITLVPDNQVKMELADHISQGTDIYFVSVFNSFYMKAEIRYQLVHLP